MDILLGTDPSMSHEQGRINSGDVQIFYRRFGKPGGCPILLFHGGNYYDSVDWIDVATALAQDREVIAFDARGFGESGWSPSKDYSHAAHMADAIGLLDHLGWTYAIAVGHSRGGAYALLLAARHPERTRGLVMIDYCPGFGIGPRGMPVVMTQSVGNTAKVFPDSGAALASTSRFKFASDDAALRSRFESILKKTPDGVVIAKRDPDFSNQVPTAPSPFGVLDVGDMWAELKNVRVPGLVFRALKSNAGYAGEDIARLRREHPDIRIVDIASGHDVVGEAPDDLTVEIRKWLDAERPRIDSQ